MPQILALEWDNSEARMVVANSRGERLVIEQAFAVQFPPRQPKQEDEEGPAEEELDVGQQIAAALSDHGVGRIETLVGVGRGSMELRHLSLPPAPDDELPDLARFEAMREFAQFDEDWLLDFVPLEEAGEDKPRDVLAAAIAPEVVEQIQRICGKAGLTPQRLVLRSCGAASLLGRADPVPAAAEPRLLIELLSGEAELTVVIGRKVVFLRTTRIGADPLGNPDHRRALLAEIRRTIAAAENQLDQRRIEAIALCGSGQQHAALAKSLAEDLGRPTKLFDPFAGLSLGLAVRQAPPEHPGRFAPLLGLALAELEQTGQAIDFLHPRRRPEPPSRRMPVVVAAVAVVLLVGAFFGYRAWQKSSIRSDNLVLTGEITRLEREVEKAKEDIKAAQAIEKWTVTDVVWLDELYRLSEDFPPASEVMLAELQISPARRGGKITIEGLVANPTSLVSMRETLGNESRSVVAGNTRADDSTRQYTRFFTDTLFVDPEEE